MLGLEKLDNNPLKQIISKVNDPYILFIMFGIVVLAALAYKTTKTNFNSTTLTIILAIIAILTAIFVAIKEFIIKKQSKK